MLDSEQHIGIVDEQDRRSIVLGLLHDRPDLAEERHRRLGNERAVDQMQASLHSMCERSANAGLSRARRPVKKHSTLGLQTKLPGKLSILERQQNMRLQLRRDRL